MKRNFPGLTEHLKAVGPTVYGYLRLTARNPARRAALTGALAGYCEEHELGLAAVFTDLACTGIPDQVLTPGFVGLLDVLATEGAYGVVLPTPGHLGARPEREVRCGLLQATGRRLMFCRTTASDAAAALRPAACDLQRPLHVVEEHHHGRPSLGGPIVQDGSG